jgi:flagellar motility protein MotE (MotC chaperone)
MSDHDVTVILGMVTDRQAAAILSNLAPERAAGISRDVLRSGRSGP